MSDFQVSVGGDFQELLRGFQQLEAQAAQSGRAVGTALGGGIQGVVQRSIDALLADLGRLKAQRNQVNVDGGQVVILNQQISAIQKQLETLRATRVAVQADPRSIDGLNQRLQTLQAELNKVAIGSQRFKELQDQIKLTERELDKIGDSSEGLRILEGAVGGVSFALTNGVVNAAGQAIGALRNLIGEFGALDTELRKAAAAGGEAGGYEKLSAAVNEVGIEAAGTQLEVAQLATELVRGGMTIDQARASLGSIVRGAEATGTAFDQMGSVVSASILGFGLKAKDATRVVDALVTGANASAASVSGLGMAFKYAAPVARILGVSVEELATAAGLLTNAGIDASEAGVTLRNGFSKLASAAPPAKGAVRDLTGQAAMAAKVMKQLGLDIYETDGTLKPMEQTLLTLKRAFDKLDPSTKIRMAANLFGGEDDGTRWLALLDQTEDDIKKMSATMAKSAGATDVARDAMQGFELKVKQLEGTVGTINNTFAALAAAALMPLIDAANAVTGAISGIPDPVKNAAGALILMTGAVVGATTAYLVLKRVLELSVAQKAAGEVVALGRALVSSLAGGAGVAAAAMPKLVDAIKAVSATNYSLKGTITAAAAGAGNSLKDLATIGVFSFQKLNAAVNPTILLNGLKNLAIGVGAAIQKLGPMAALIGLIAWNVSLWQETTKGADAVTKSFAGSQKALDESSKKLSKTLGENIIQVEKSRNAYQELVRRAAEVRSLERFRQENDKVTNSLEFSTDAALKFYKSLGDSSGTAQQKKTAKEVAVELNNQADAARNAAAQQRALADEADAAGNTALAQSYRSAATEADTYARTQGNLAEAIRLKTGLTKEEIATAARQEEIEKQRLATTKLLTTEKEAQIAEARAAGALNEEQAQTAQRLLNLEAARNELETQRRKAAEAAPGSEQEQQALQKIAELRTTVAQLELQGSQAVVEKRQQIFTIAKDLLSIQQTSLEIERQQGELTKARLQDQRNYLDAALALQGALSQLTASQFSVDSARQGAAIAQAERALQDLRDRKASAAEIRQQEEAIASLKRNAETIERQALAAQITAAAQRFDLERRVLALKQAQQVIDAQAAQAAARRNVLEQGQKLLGLQGQSLDPGLSPEQRTVLDRQIAQQRELVNLAIEQQRYESARLPVLAAIQGLERQTLDAQQQTTANGFRAQAATRDWERTLNGPLSQLDAAAQASQQLGAAVQSFTVGTITANGQTVTLRAQVEAVQSASWDSANAAIGMAAGYDAANQAATRLLTTLQRVAAIPQGRWTGGPVEAGATYRVNELGQEALLSPGGALSLIGAPARSLWRAPSSGTVLPAGVTANLKASGAFGASTGGNTGKLQQAIDRLSSRMDALVAKNWDLQVVAPSNAALLRTVAGF